MGLPTLCLGKPIGFSHFVASWSVVMEDIPTLVLCCMLLSRGCVNFGIIECELKRDYAYFSDANVKQLILLLT